MSERILYCPRCGDVMIVFDKDTHYCITCKKQKMIDTGHTDDYFRKKYYDKVGKNIDNIIKFNLDEMVRQEFVYNNPLYNEEDVKKRIELNERCAKKRQQKSRDSKFLPKCPTCGSTNVEKISGVSKVGKVALFGIFAAGSISKTFKCKNCGMKF